MWKNYAIAIERLTSAMRYLYPIASAIFSAFGGSTKEEIKEEEGKSLSERWELYKKRILGTEVPPSGEPTTTGSSSGAVPSAIGSAESRAIAGIESGGKYKKVGPVTRNGDRAYGKYQVMGHNIPDWTREVLGHAMTPQQFLNDPNAQEAVFKAKFGQAEQKYGAEGAARWWFAGPGGMNNPNANDRYTSVAQYAAKFNKNMSGAALAASSSVDNSRSNSANTSISVNNVNFNTPGITDPSNVADQFKTGIKRLEAAYQATTPGYN
jgi:hypothetical protein